MPTFQYQSVTKGGEASTGTIEAGNRNEAVRLLMQRGEVAVDVQPQRGAGGWLGGGSGSGSRAATATASSAPAAARPVTAANTTPSSGRARRGGGMRRSELTGFIREIATALEAGLPLMSALRAVAKQATSDRQLAILNHLMDRIEAGRSFAQAAHEWGTPFNDMIVGMLRAGEASGQLDTVMLQLADLLDRDLEVRRNVIGALIYPAILVVLLAIGVIIIVTFIVPRVLSTLEGMVIELPLPTRIVQGVAFFFGSYWYLILGAIAICWVAWRSAMAKPHLKREFHAFLLRLPVAGSLLRDVAVGRFTRTLGTLMSSGILILDGLLITRDTLGNKAMEAVIDEVAIQVRDGKSLADPMEKSGFFPQLLIQVISLGEKSGRLDQMLLHAANAFDRRTNAAVKLFTNVLPPIIVIFMAVIIGFVVLAVLLPLLEVQSSI